MMMNRKNCKDRETSLFFLVFFARFAVRKTIIVTKL